MQFNSYSYLVFLAAAVVLFWSLPVHWRRWFVLGVSLLFYASWNVYFVVLPILICGFVYVCARAMIMYPQRSGAWLLAGVVGVLSVLGLFKYGAFFWENFGGVFGGGGHAFLFAAIGLPLGISFYSFEAISYLLDSRQGRVASLNFLDLCLFVVFWPHLIAGPIVRVRELIPQLKFAGTFKAEFLITGLNRFVWGLVQKNLFANSLGSWVDAGFLPRAALLNTSIDNWALAVAFGLQIYFDFAAYSNMAIGAAHMIGVRLPENFRYPYHAWNPADFWSRWHMTLSRWVRDYLFFPLNARFDGSVYRLYLSSIGVMALVGLWHGAGFGFILWGVMQGVFLVMYRIFEGIQISRGQVEMKWLTRLGCRLFTLAAVCAAWIPFRAKTLGQSWTMLSSMFARPNLGITYSVNFYLITLLIALVCVAEPYLERLCTRVDESMNQRESGLSPQLHLYFVRPLLYAFGLLLFLVFDDQDTLFIYFQF